MSSKRGGKVTLHFRSSKQTSAPPASKTRQAKRQRTENEKAPDPEVLARSQGEGAVTRGKLRFVGHALNISY